METFWQDVKYGARMLAKNKGVSLIAIIALALGIGANTAIFSAVDSLLLRPLPFPEPERLVILWGTHPQIGREEASPPDYLDWRTQSQSFEVMAASSFRTVTLAGVEEPERIQAAAVTGDLLAVLRAKSFLGRGFVPEEDVPGGPRAVVLTYGLWQRRFGGDPSILGRSLVIDGYSHAVVGVLPASVQLPPGVELWVPLARDLAKDGRRNDYLLVAARLKPGVTLEQARADLNTIMGRLEKDYPVTNAGWRADVVPMHEQLVGEIKPALLVLMGAVGFVLLIACTNVANLLLGRAAARTREIAIRATLGAGRARLIRLLLVESCVLSFAGGLLGVLIAVWGVDALLAMGPGNLAEAAQVSVDARVLAFTGLLSVATGLLFGLAPALHASRTEFSEALKEGGRASGSRGRHRLRSLFVTAEVALSLVLLVGAGLMIKSLNRIMSQNPGFNRENLLTFAVNLPSLKYPQDSQRLAFYNQMLERLRALPGVESATLTHALPLNGGAGYWAFTIAGRPAPPPEVVEDAIALFVGDRYVETMGIPLVKGRSFEPQDVRAPATVVLINQTMARRYFPGQDPIGQRLTFGNPQDPKAVWWTIVGVVADSRHRPLETASYPTVLVPQPRPTTAVVLRTRGHDSRAVAPMARQIVREMDRSVPFYALRTMDEVLARALRQQRYTMLLMSLFAGVAMLLAAVGIYGVMSYSVTQRTHEIGVRMALGAQRSNILKLVVGEGIQLTLVGLGAGLAVALGLTRFLENLIRGVRPTDPATFAAVSLLLVAVALLACYVPARRATRVDPMVALRHE